MFLATRRARTATGVGGLALDLTALPDERVLHGTLSGFDVVINTVGIFLQAGQQTFDAVHVNGPRRLFEAAAAAGVGRWVQLSALGADPASPLPYFASKGRMDALLRGLDSSGAGRDATAGAGCQVDVAVVRPSLVFAAEGTSTRWFAQLASLPITPLPGGGRHLVQPLHLDDLVDALVGLVEARQAPPMLEAVGPGPLPLRDYLQVFKRAMNSGSAFVPVSMRLLRWLARIGPRLGAPFDADALSMLQAGNTADARPFQRWLGRPARAPDVFIEPAVATRMRQHALLAWTLPTMRIALAAMWIATAVVSLWVYPRVDSLAMLAQVGLKGGAALAALWTGALVDLAFGVGMLFRRIRPIVYGVQLALVLAYTIIITVWLPEQWAHPFGPVLKNLPLLAMILALLMLDRDRGPHPR